MDSNCKVLFIQVKLGLLCQNNLWTQKKEHRTGLFCKTPEFIEVFVTKHKLIL